MSFDGRGVLDISVLNNRWQASGRLQLGSRVPFQELIFTRRLKTGMVNCEQIAMRVQQGQARG